MYMYMYTHVYGVYNVTCTTVLQFAHAGVFVYKLDPMNREVLLLVGLFMGASLAAMVRNIAFTLAGERFVARLRKNVSECFLQYKLYW